STGEAAKGRHQGDPGRHRGLRVAARILERHARLQQMRQADAHPQDRPAQRGEGDRLREVRRDLRTGKKQGMSVTASPPRVELRLKERYQGKIVPAVMQGSAYATGMQVQ